MIVIEEPFIEKNGEKSRLVCNTFVNECSKRIYFEADKEYEKYLCWERCDAFVIGLLSWAMRKHHDIHCKAPITEELLYNINEYLIPSLTKYDKRLYNVKIIAPVETEAMQNAGAVGTGVSGGVDSFHAILNNTNGKYKNLQLTHLCINSVGSFHRGYKDYGIENIKQERYAAAKEIANIFGLPLIKSDSNIKQHYDIHFDFIHTYSSMFAVYCMQKLWKTYLYGSHGYDFGNFSLANNSTKPSGYYELLSLPCFSTHNLKIYSEGGTKDRLSKTQFIVDNEIVQKYLHVCVTSGKNCGRCIKCKRTILTLDALGKLEDFKNVFNLDYYNKNKEEYMLWLYENKKDAKLKLVYSKLKKEIKFKTKLLYYFNKYLPFLFSKHKNNTHTIYVFLGIKISLKYE